MTNTGYLSLAQMDYLIWARDAFLPVALVCFWVSSQEAV
jgi:hypothetical protein